MHLGRASGLGHHAGAVLAVRLFVDVVEMRDNVMAAPGSYRIRMIWSANIALKWPQFAVSLGCGLIKPEPEADASDFDHCEIVESAAVVSGRDVSELLELIEAALDEVALFVFGFAIGDAVVTVRSRRDVWGAVLVLDQIPDPVRVVSFVGDDLRACGQIIEQELGHWCVVHLARRKLDLDRQAVADYPQV